MRIVFSLSLISLFVFTGLTLVIPILPLYAKSFGAKATMIGLVVAAFPISRIIFSLPGGILLKILKVKRTILTSLIIIIIGAVNNAFANSYYSLIVGRFIEGIGSAIYLTTMLTIIGLAAPKDKRGRAMSSYYTIIDIGLVASPAIGGFIAEVYGYSYAYFAYALLALTALVISLFAMKRIDLGSDIEKEKVKISLVEVKKLLQNKSYLALCVVGAFVFFSRIGIRGTLIPLYANQNLLMSEIKIGLLLTVTSLMDLLTAYPFGWLSDKYGRKPILLFSSLITGITIFLVPIFQTELSLWLLMALFGSASSVFGALMAWITDKTPKEMMSVSMGLNRTIISMGSFLGPLTLGLVIDLTTYNGFISSYPFLASSLVIFSSFILILLTKK
jgi:MFS family permease